MSQQRLIPLAVATGAVTAVLAFVLLVVRAGPSAARSPASGDPPSVQVVVPTGFVPAGTALDRDRLTTKLLPSTAVPPGAAIEPSEVVDRPALVPLFRDEPILLPRVGGAASAVQSLVPPGRTLFALPISAPVAVGGVIAGGDTIAIIGSTSTRREDGLSVLLADVSVLGVAGEFPFGPRAPRAGTAGASDAEAARAGGRDVQKILLVDVSLDEAALLAQAVENGRLYVALKPRAGSARTGAGGQLPSEAS